ncbi:MAG: sulfate permease, partial [Deltaproteobacteria bacterium]|nr:sulfate permease [Deltaproteobacteria bacterium]
MSDIKNENEDSKSAFPTFIFNRLEFSGSLGDLGTLLPIAIAMIVLNGLNV